MLGIVEGEPGIFPDPVARLLRRLFHGRRGPGHGPRGVELAPADRWPAMAQLLGAYLNIEWVDDYESPWDAVDDFLAHEPFKSGLAKDARAIVAAGRTEKGIGSILADLGMGYVPEANGSTKREWLLELGRRADSPRA